MAQIGVGSDPVTGGATGQHHPVLPDEQALRRAYDQHADALVAAAAARLGESAYLAPRVMEQAFVRAWHGRIDIGTEADLAAFLKAEVEHGAARTLSRQLAAHRLGHHGSGGPRGNGHARPEGAYDHEASWPHVVEGVRADVRNADAHSRAAAIAHHDAAVHIAEVTRPGSWVKPVLLGVATVGLAIGAVWVMDNIGQQTRIRSAVTSGAVRTVAASAGQLGALELADGSQVRLAPESQLFIPEKFGPDLRGVRIEGAGRFVVAPGLEEPFTVVVGQALVTAAGTAFTVRDYPGEPGATIALHEGTVTVTAHDSVVTLAPGQGLFVPDSAPPRAPTAGELAEAVSWTDNTYVADNRAIADVLTDFQRWYRTQIFAVDPKVLERRVSFRASLDSVRQAISAVEREGNVQFGYISGKMVFTARK